MKVLLWDCASCKQIGFPASTHKFCSGCGSPQEPSKLYPVASKNNGLISDVYTDGDYSCLKCNAPASGAHKFCCNCGFDLKTENSESQPNSFLDKFKYEYSNAKKKLGAGKKKQIEVRLSEKQNPFVIRRKRKIGTKLVLILCFALIGWLGFTFSQSNNHLAAKTRSAIETFFPFKTPTKKGWCDKIPKDAKILSTKMKKRKFCVERKGKARKGKRCSGKIKKKLSEYCYYS